MVVLNYTYLHAFTRIYTKFLAGNVTGGNEGEITAETQSQPRKLSGQAGAWNQYGDGAKPQGHSGTEPRHRGARRRAGKNLGRSGIRPYRALGGAELCGKNYDFYAFFRGSPRFYARNRAVNPRCLASQARHEMGAPVELFAGAKRRAGAELCGKVREGSR